MFWYGNSGVGYQAVGKRYRYWIYRSVHDGRTSWVANRARITRLVPLWMDIPGYVPPPATPRREDKSTLSMAKEWVASYDQEEE